MNVGSHVWDMGIKWLWVEGWLYSPDLMVEAASKLRGLVYVCVGVNKILK